ncbi:fimbrial protein [Pseudomonas sp. WS 5532]|uniref:fimbrial protein n=1 Tax=Pseudomonas TaxID=286 RepID=UPI00147545CF|nr:MULTISPECIES: fimbrial protein [Pseudomonas]MCK3840336.1 fimbrial protein [Pseudomonas sp. NCIMB 10586]MCK3846758.1 fimbrial protein [Pseudomonas sp. W15Feb34]NMX72772.1 fimbrial protein [Pseudomonas sp. WS 5532]QXI56489.1 fimbrial protein [Pseudomonas sp. OE 28.3]
MRILQLCIGLALIMFGWQVKAATSCTYSSLSLKLPVSFAHDSGQPGMISSSWHEASSPALMTCDLTSSGQYSVTASSALPVSGMFSFENTFYALLNTSVPGISLIMAVADTKGQWLPYQGIELTTYKGDAPVYSSYGIKVRVRLVATTRLDSGSYNVSAETLLSTGITKDAVYTGSAFTSLTGTVVTAKSPACKLYLSVTTIALPKIKLADIPVAGAIAGTTPVVFAAVCEGAASAYNVKYALLDMNDWSATDKYVALRPASGGGNIGSVALQIAEGSTVMNMGTFYSLGLIQSQGGFFSKTLDVSYVRRSMVALNPGKFVGAVSILLSYD